MKIKINKIDQSIIIGDTDPKLMESSVILTTLINICLQIGLNVKPYSISFASLAGNPSEMTISIPVKIIEKKVSALKVRSVEIDDFRELILNNNIVVVLLKIITP